MKKKSNVSLARRIKRNSVYYVMIAPFFLIFFLFIFIPVISAVVLSLTSFDMVQLPSFVGFENYIRLLFDDDIFLINSHAFSKFGMFHKMSEFSVYGNSVFRLKQGIHHLDFFLRSMS